MQPVLSSKNPTQYPTVRDVSINADLSPGLENCVPSVDLDDHGFAQQDPNTQ